MAEIHEAKALSWEPAPKESQRNANSDPTSAALGMPGQKPQPSPNVPGGERGQTEQDLKMTKGKMGGGVRSTLAPSSETLQ